MSSLTYFNYILCLQETCCRLFWNVTFCFYVHFPEGAKMFASNLCPKMKIERVRFLTAGYFVPKILYLLNFFLEHLLNILRVIGCLVIYYWNIFIENRQQSELYSDSKWNWLINDCFTTISGHFFAICMFVFHKTEVQTVILRCLTGLNLKFWKYDSWFPSEVSKLTWAN